MTTTIKKDFDAVKFMRQERDRISQEIAEMSHEQIKEYFAKKEQRREFPIHENFFLDK